MRAPFENDLFRHVREVLLTHWDPIGVQEIPQAQDEYDSYIWPSVRMVREGATADELYQYLVGIETGSMGGIGGDVGRLLRTVTFLERLGPPRD